MNRWELLFAHQITCLKSCLQKQALKTAQTLATSSAQGRTFWCIDGDGAMCHEQAPNQQIKPSRAQVSTSASKDMKHEVSRQTKKCKKHVAMGRTSQSIWLYKLYLWLYTSLQLCRNHVSTNSSHCCYCQCFDTGIAECSTVEHLFEAIFTVSLELGITIAKQISTLPLMVSCRSMSFTVSYSWLEYLTPASMYKITVWWGETLSSSKNIEVPLQYPSSVWTKGSSQKQWPRSTMQASGNCAFMQSLCLFDLSPRSSAITPCQRLAALPALPAL